MLRGNTLLTEPNQPHSAGALAWQAWKDAHEAGKEPPALHTAESVAQAAPSEMGLTTTAGGGAVKQFTEIYNVRWGSSLWAGRCGLMLAQHVPTDIKCDACAVVRRTHLSEAECAFLRAHRRRKHFTSLSTSPRRLFSSWTSLTDRTAINSPSASIFPVSFNASRMPSKSGVSYAASAPRDSRSSQPIHSRWLVPDEMCCTD